MLPHVKPRTFSALLRVKVYLYQVIIVYVFTCILFFLPSFRCPDSPLAKLKNSHQTKSEISSSFDQKMVENMYLKKSEETYKKNLIARKIIAKRIKCAPNIPVALCGQHAFEMVFFTPTWPCPRELHVGLWGEGGKWICNVSGAVPKNSAVVYSIGSHGDPSFEKAMHESFRATSYTFDPTLTPQQLKRVSNLSFLEFHNVGLSGSKNPDKDKALFGEGVLSPQAKFMRIDQIMKTLGHHYIDVFKIDCEGCEVGFMKHLKTISNRKKPLFGQIIMEIHKIRMKEMMPLLQSIEDVGYRLFHVEKNFLCKESCWELAYIHESLLGLT